MCWRFPGLNLLLPGIDSISVLSASLTVSCSVALWFCTQKKYGRNRRQDPRENVSQCITMQMLRIAWPPKSGMWTPHTDKRKGPEANICIVKVQILPVLSSQRVEGKLRPCTFAYQKENNWFASVPTPFSFFIETECWAGGHRSNGQRPGLVTASIAANQLITSLLWATFAIGKMRVWHQAVSDVPSILQNLSLF